MSIIANTAGSMAFREKIAWLSLGSIAIAFIPYFIWVSISPPTNPLPDFDSMRLFAAAAVTQMILLGGGHIWLRMRMPDEARTPADERDRAIAHRAVALAYYVLISGVILVGCVLPFTKNGWALINAAVAVIVIAELVHYGVSVWCYRRGTV
ncbi:MAG: hypothetical protein AAF432_01440 [Planctomycetota bacterium]